MKQRSHTPSPSRRVSVCAALFLVSLLFSTVVAYAADERRPAPPRLPAMAVPVPLPTIDLAAPATPAIQLPNLGPVAPTVQAPAEMTDNMRRIDESLVANHRANLEQRTSHTARVEYAEALIRLGEYPAAIAELLAIEKAFPGAYINALDLGHAYELSANLVEARRWLEEGLRRNPDASNGTAWLQLAIVEARCELANDPDWLRRHSVLEKHADKSDKEILRAIDVQLAERTAVRKAPDPTISDLYFEAAMRSRSAETRREFFSRSLQWGDLRRVEIENQGQIFAQIFSESAAP